MSSRTLVYLLFSFLLTQAVDLSAQTATGEVVGTVKDSTGAVLPSVKLTILRESDSQERTTTTDSTGNFAVPALLLGRYTIRAELSGFKVQVRSGVVLNVGRQEQVDFVLEVGEVSETVTVEESGGLLQTANAEVSEVIDNQRVTSLPLNGRQFVDLTLLSDNVFRRASWYTRFRSRADWTGNACRRSASRTQHVLYGWRLGDRPVFQSFGCLASYRRDPGIQHPKIHLSSRIWR